MSIFTISLLIFFAIFSIILHEIAHGYVANLFGDKTAKLSGRLTLNPFKHIDILGTVIVPIVMYYSTGYIYGWAKPVPINKAYFRKPNRDSAIVALAGPATNFGLAIIFAFLIKLSNDITISDSILNACLFAMYINTILCAFNILPIPPLDGSRILSAFLKGKMKILYAKLEDYWFIIFVLLILTNAMWWFVNPILGFIQFLIASITQLNV